MVHTLIPKLPKATWSAVVSNQPVKPYPEQPGKIPDKECNLLIIGINI
jgi:hypothetical protein